jgi:triosephosphate isomerase (TIM)
VILKEKLVVCNWKEYGTKTELQEYIRQLEACGSSSSTSLILAVPAPLIHSGIEAAAKLYLAAQTVDYTSGTGRVTGRCLNSIGCKYSLCGHSELGGVDKRAQILECINNQITPIVLIEGEPDFFNNHLPGCIWVYEPSYSIGSGLLPKLEEIEKVISTIKATDGEANVLYGGSVTSENLEYLLRAKDLDGFCIGGASRKVEEMVRILDLLSSTNK